MMEWEICLLYEPEGECRGASGRKLRQECVWCPNWRRWNDRQERQKTKKKGKTTMETKAKTFTELLAGVGGAIAAFFTGLSPIIWILLAVMTIDYITGIICGLMGKSEKTENGGLASSAAFRGLLKKMLIILVVLLAALLDKAVALKAGVEFEAVAGFTCLWFIASEGFSILENVATMGVPVPKILLQALEVMKAKGGGEDKKQQKEEILWGADEKKYRRVIDAEGGTHWELIEDKPEETQPEEEKPPAE